MKLDHRRTILVGLAFLSICAFWQMYDSVIPKILTETFHLNETLSGAIMALDNILALFLLPLFGALSDRTSTMPPPAPKNPLTKPASAPASRQKPMRGCVYSRI